MMNVVIVDDELLMRIGLKSMIDWEENGFKIVGEATNGEEALQMITLYKPDLVITDIKMPLMDGLGLIHAVQQKQDNCMFIILSCMDEFQYAKEALRLGAIDYLIKSDLKPDQLIQVLEKVASKKSVQKTSNEEAVLHGQYKESLIFLKENFFKELLSGFVKEADILERARQVQFQVNEGPMLLTMFSIRKFNEVKQKYVEQDEKLLRYAIVNILDEVIPRKYKKEIVIQNSASYFVLLKLDDHNTTSESLEQLFRKILLTFNDFLKIDFDLTVSSKFNSLMDIRSAYFEIDSLLEEYFFVDELSIIYAEKTLRTLEKRKECYSLTKEQTTQLREWIELNDIQAYRCLEDIHSTLLENNISSQGIRKLYLSLLSFISSCFPILPEQQEDELSPYELILLADKCSSLPSIIIGFMELCFMINKSDQHQSYSYGLQARKIMLARFHEEISLQSVAKEINVNASYLSRVFKQETGETFVNALTSIRIEHAQRLLRNSQVKIYDIAAQCGYPNTAYFSKIFKKVTGFSPEDYRQQGMDNTSKLG